MRSIDAMTPRDLSRGQGSEQLDRSSDIAEQPRRHGFEARRGSENGSKSFAVIVADIEAGKPDRLPNFSMMRFRAITPTGSRLDTRRRSSTSPRTTTRSGRLVEAVSNSPYWKDTAIFMVEDDAQDGPDHVDCHRAPALVISAYNRPGRAGSRISHDGEFDSHDGNSARDAADESARRHGCADRHLPGQAGPSALTKRCCPKSR